MYFPLIEEQKQTRSYIQAFRGYNNNLRIEDDEFSYTKNVSCEDYPILTTRRKRAIKKNSEDAKGIIAKDALAWVAGTSLFYNGKEIVGLDLSDKGPKQLVSMGAYICIFPDNIYFNTKDMTDFGSMESSFTIEAPSEGETATEVTLTLSRKDGDSYTDYAIAEPEAPDNGEFWLDMSADTHVLKQWSSSSAMWVQVPTVYVKIEAPNIGKYFEEGDGVIISNLTGNSQIEALNGSRIVESKQNNSIVVIGMLDQLFVTDRIKVERKVPKMDYITEAGNRLWGCYYGLKDNETINELYCCKLGDFKNWECYQGLSTDSWRASVGTDGEFTGAITHLGYPILFKENCFHKIYVSAEGAHQVVTTNARGIQKGSWQSAVIVNEMLYYKSRTDVCVFDGSLPQGISDVFGDAKYFNASAGAIGSRYYISMEEADGTPHLFVYDIDKGIWMREDNTKATYFAKKDDDLYMLVGNGVASVYGTDGETEGDSDGETEGDSEWETEGDLEWEIQTGNIGYDTPDKKYLSRFNLRMEGSEGAKIHVAMQYDSSGVWEPRGTFICGRLGTFTLPIPARRCDHCRIKVYGTKDIKLYSIAKVYEQGSDV